MMNIWSEIKAIIKAPITEKLDTAQLFMIVGLVLVFIVAWLVILKYMTAGVQTIAEEI